MLRWSDPVLPVEREVAPVLVASVRVLGFISLSPTYWIAKQLPFGSGLYICTIELISNERCVIGRSE
jgi:hypothetical protein